MLDWKLKIPMIIFAPFSQMGFLASYIFYWNKGDPEQEVGQTLQYQHPKITPTLSKYKNQLSHLIGCNIDKAFTMGVDDGHVT